MCVFSKCPKGGLEMTKSLISCLSFCAWAGEFCDAQDYSVNFDGIEWLFLDPPSFVVEYKDVVAVGGLIAVVAVKNKGACFVWFAALSWIWWGIQYNTTYIPRRRGFRYWFSSAELVACMKRWKEWSWVSRWWWPSFQLLVGATLRLSPPRFGSREHALAVEDARFLVVVWCCQDEAANSAIDGLVDGKEVEVCTGNKDKG